MATRSEVKEDMEHKSFRRCTASRTSWTEHWGATNVEMLHVFCHVVVLDDRTMSRDACWY